MRALCTFSLLAAFALAGCGASKKKADAAVTPAPAASTPAATTPAAPKADPRLSRKPKVTPPSGKAPTSLVVKDLIKGTGAPARAGQLLTVQYVGVLYKSGKQFDASWDRGQPFQFPLGQGQVIPGWDNGLVGMKIGGRRELIIPPADGYGAQGSPPVIPPNAPLVFVIDLQGAQG